jgi:hypothetical protein
MAHNRLLGVQPIKKKHNIKPAINESDFPNRKCLFNVETGEGEMFFTLEDIAEALESGLWVKRPGDTGPKVETVEEDLIASGQAEYIKKDPPEEEEINWVERLKFRNSESPRAPKRDMSQYISQMTVAQLIVEGKKWG